MSLTKNRRRALLSWLFVSALLVLCGVLGFLQYRWIGEVSVAARERLRGSLLASLNRFSRDFNAEISTAAAALVPSNAAPDAQAVEATLAAHYAEWKKTSRHSPIFSRIAIAEPQEGVLVLRMLDPNTGKLEKADWPETWSAVRDRIDSRIGARPGPRRNATATVSENDSLAFEAPLFGNSSPGFFNPSGRSGFSSQEGPARGPASGSPGRFGPPDGSPGGFGRPNRRGQPDGMPGRSGSAGHPPDFPRPPDGNGPPAGPPFHPGPDERPPNRLGTPNGPLAPFGRREVAWVILELNLAYLRESVLPELLQRDLADYEVAILTRARPPALIYQSDPGDTRPISGHADASVGIFTGQSDSRPVGRGAQAGPGPGPGRWEMFARHRAGSLEAVVTRLRWRNLALTGGVLVLMLASVAALVRYTRRAQKLAQVQMDFVAGISHELRTPLTVIHTAGYNLRGKMAQNPAQVERYGALIQQESGRLTDLVEQIMRFAGVEAGRIIREPEPLSIESVIHDTMESNKAVMEQAHCVVEQTIEDGLPPILGDPTALRHALQNLLSNAAKYGTAGDNTTGSNWIGISAAKATERGRAMVEIRVADRGPGIPKSEQTHIFDPFFRGQRAVEDQVHGTGLGLNLVKKIVEAHGGTIRVKSEPMKGAEFIVRIPEATQGVAG